MHMKNKLLSAMLVCLLFVNACNINNIYDAKISNTVPDTAVYFEGKQIVLADKYKTSKEYSFAVIRTEFLNENYIAVMIHAEGVASTNIRSEDYIEIYDYSGELNQQIDLHSFGKGESFTGACIGQTETGMCVLLANNKSSNITIYEVDKDFEEWNKQISITLSSIKTGFSPKKIYKLGKEYLIIYDWLEGDYYKTGVLRIDDLGKTKGDWQINSNDAISNIDLWENKLVYRDENNNDYRTLDISSGKCQRIPISDNQYSMYKYGKIISGNIIVKEGIEIRKYSLAEGSETLIHDLNYTNYNIASLLDGYLIYAGTNRIVILDQGSTRNEAPGRCKLIVLNKVDKNPNVGKKIIEIAPIWGVSTIVGESQRIFNQSNKEFYSYISTRYDVDYFNPPEYYRREPTLADTVTLITDQLSADIRNGNGPDIVIGLGDTTQLDSQTYLVDLYPYINGSEGIKKEEYFENAFDAFSEGTHLYQVPLTINVLGVMTDRANVEKGKDGFTFEEYVRFVKEKCEGIDPISIGNNREQYFRLLFCSMHECFVNNKTINIDNKEFSDLAEYSKNYIVEEGYNSDVDLSGAKWVVLSDVYNDIIESPCFNPTFDIYGAPSYDGRGPMITEFNTIAITSCSSNIVASWQYIKTAIGYDVQVSVINANPINRIAFCEYAKKAIQDANITLKARYDSRVLDETDIKRYESLLEKAYCVATFDTEVYQVIIEELQPYYADDKDLDKVIPVIKNRCQTILNER